MGLKKQVFEPIITLLKTFSGNDDVEVNIPDYNNVFAFYSPSGGTGITTFVANLSYVLGTQVKVAVVDFDLFHPCLYRFLLDESSEASGLRVQSDLVDKLITSGAAVTSFGHASKLQNVTLFTGMPQNDILKFCELDYNNILIFLRELSRLYDIVLIDLKGNFTQETVMATIEGSTRVFTFVRPLMSDADSLYKDNALLARYGYGRKLNTVIQSGIQERFLAEDEFGEGIKDIMHIPYVKSVEETGESFEIFYATNAGSSKAGAAYADCCKFMAEYLVNYKRFMLEERGGK